jgi:hypothetical protein
MEQQPVEKRFFESRIATVGSLFCKDVLQPLAAIGKQSLHDFLERTQYLVQLTREEIEDIVAEAQYERLRKKLDREIANE